LLSFLSMWSPAFSAPIRRNQQWLRLKMLERNFKHTSLRVPWTFRLFYYSLCCSIIFILLYGRRKPATQLKFPLR
jgi:hypothetical protein